ncbi:hypothetical protein EVAR_79482_1 [Eumeta japonica]|uniref:Uncharacterized protein n=1 Tax=Eumeta variegata TaxID=151549 RepID=A0A4C1UDL9_EUMVA|nr:hypothetical protein EVAR_79482_1 [Eumeta japonica]
MRYAPLTLCAHNRASEARVPSTGMVSPPKSERDKHKSERHVPSTRAQISFQAEHKVPSPVGLSMADHNSQLSRTHLCWKPQRSRV